MTWKRKKLTPIQITVLENLQSGRRARLPRSSLERLQKKGFVDGNRREGWKITRAGLRWLNMRGISGS